MKKFNGYYAGWNRCECGQTLKITKANNLVHLHGNRTMRIGNGSTVNVHDYVLRRKEAI